MFKRISLFTLLLVSLASFAHADSIYHCGSTTITLSYGMSAGHGKVKIDYGMSREGVPMIVTGSYIMTQKGQEPLNIKLIGFGKELHLYDDKNVLVNSESQEEIAECSLEDKE